MRRTRLFCTVVVHFLTIDRAIPTDCSGVGNLSHVIAELRPFLSTDEVTRLTSFVGAGPIADTHNPCFHAPKTAALMAEKTLNGGADHFGAPYACLPGVLIVGAHKSGSTDLFSRLGRHWAVVAEMKHKEHSFWCNIGISSAPGHAGDIWHYAEKFARGTRAVRGLSIRAPQEDPTRVLAAPWEQAAERVHPRWGPSYVLPANLAAQHALLVDATPANSYCLLPPPVPLKRQHKQRTEPGVTAVERVRAPPRQLTPSVARALLGARAKVILITRDPVERTYSDYRYFRKFQSTRECGGATGPRQFHDRMVTEVSALRRCLAPESRRGTEGDCTAFCAQLGGGPPWSSCPPGRPFVSLVDLFAAEWRRQFGAACNGGDGGGEAPTSAPPAPALSQQLLEVRLEDLAADPAHVMEAVARFLGLPIEGEDGRRALAAMSGANKSVPEHFNDRSRFEGGAEPRPEPMFPETRALLESFFRDHAGVGASLSYEGLCRGFF